MFIDVYIVVVEGMSGSHTTMCMYLENGEGDCHEVHCGKGGDWRGYTRVW